MHKTHCTYYLIKKNTNEKDKPLFIQSVKQSAGTKVPIES